MWGLAGVGKSALAQTCAEKVKKMGYLGAAFFFSINGRRDHRPFFVTLAYQLSTVLPDYSQLLDTIICRDKTLVEKTMESQFDSLIVQPVQALARQGKAVGQMAIFVDGLDECQDTQAQETQAQEDIVKLIAASVRTKSTPFLWAIFSRAETHIRSTFEDQNPIARIVELPIASPDEVEIYIRHEFRNILRRHNQPLTPSWPADKDIKALVEAAGGLFAYAAAVLRYIDLSEALRLDEPLHDVLNSASRGGSGPFAQLDALYMHIMQRIPEHMLSSTQLLLYSISQSKGMAGISIVIAQVCNELGLSQSDFLCMDQYLCVVLKVKAGHDHLVLPDNVDPSRSYTDQRRLFQRHPDFFKPMQRVAFHHKSFYDFLIDPARSSSFCITTPAIRTKLFDCYIRRHHHFAQCYALRGNSTF
jgi:hypothetical protein